MGRKLPGMIVIVSQLLVVSVFFVSIFSDDVTVERYVSTVHNDNLNKIATSVSVLFEEEVIPVEDDLSDFVIEELPSIDVIQEEVEKIEEELEEKKEESTPLVSVDASKYTGNTAMGFIVTEDNKNYYLEGYEFDVVVAVVAGEFDKNRDDALAVMSVILNRCDSTSWSRWAGASPYSQVIKAGQFEVYFAGYYLSYMPGGKYYGGEKYEVAKQAVIDGLNGIRNNEYLGFRAGYLTNYSDKYIVAGGNRYGYN
jgi:hypothetical protein